MNYKEYVSSFIEIAEGVSPMTNFFVWLAFPLALLVLTAFIILRTIGAFFVFALAWLLVPPYVLFRCVRRFV